MKFLELLYINIITHIYRDREEPHNSPLPHHAAYGSVRRGSADRASSAPGERKPK